MKRIVLLSIVVSLLTAVSTATAEPNGNLDEILANMQKAARGIRSITAHLQQETRDPQIGGKGQIASGQIIFAHSAGGDDKVRINYDRPEGQAICVAGDEITLYQKLINQATITRRRSLAQKNQEFDFIATPYSSISSLKARYDIVHVGDEQANGANTAKLLLTPKQQSSVKQLTLWVDQSSWLPIKYQVIQSDKTITTFTLSGVTLNPKLASDAFRLKLPPGTKIVRP